MFSDHSCERGVAFNVSGDKKEITSYSAVNQSEIMCLCKIKRDSTVESMKVESISKLFIRDTNIQYNKFIIKDMKKIDLNFEIFENLPSKNSNIEIFFCNHIKASIFLTFYEFMISDCLPNDKMTLDTFYTILYFLEYLRVKYDDKLRKVLRLCFVNLSISINTDNFDIETVSFHFSKQEYFSHQLFKKLSQEYFKFSKFKINMIDPFFPKKETSYDFKRFEGLYNYDRKHTLIVNDYFNFFFSEKVDLK